MELSKQLIHNEAFVGKIDEFIELFKQLFNVLMGKCRKSSLILVKKKCMVEIANMKKHKTIFNLETNETETLVCPDDEELDPTSFSTKKSLAEYRGECHDVFYHIFNLLITIKKNQGKNLFFE